MTRRRLSVCTNCLRPVRPGCRTDPEGNHRCCLSGDQQVLAVENTGLVGLMLHKFQPWWQGWLSEDEVESLLLETLCRVAARYNADLGWKLSAYFSRAAWNALSRAVEAAREDRCYSLNYAENGYTSDWLATDHDFPDLDAQEEIATLKAKLSSLPGKVQRVVRWRYFDHLTLEEIGRRLGVSKERARQLIAVGIAKLKERMGVAT